MFTAVFTVFKIENDERLDYTDAWARPMPRHVRPSDTVRFARPVTPHIDVLRGRRHIHADAQPFGETGPVPNHTGFALFRAVDHATPIRTDDVEHVGVVRAERCHVGALAIVLPHELPDEALLPHCGNSSRSRTRLSPASMTRIVNPGFHCQGKDSGFSATAAAIGDKRETSPRIPAFPDNS